MTKLKFERLAESNTYEVVAAGVRLGSHLLGGHLIMGDDGFYRFWVRTYGEWNLEDLVEVVEKLRELNADWAKKVEELHESED